jgi:hypothetical protein
MRGRKFLCGLVALIAIIVASAGRAADLKEQKPLGMLTAKGSVWVDRLPVPSATAVFAGDSVATDASGAAILRLDSGATAALAGEGEIELPRDATANTLNLRKGVLSIRSAGEGATRVSVLGSLVDVGGTDGYPAICTIAALGNSASVVADKGRVTIHGAGGPISLSPGKVVRWEAGAHPRPPQTAQKAGTVSGAIPAETVERKGQTAPLVLKVNDEVNWQDLVKTQNTGRVRIALLDGSTLNVGARSEMRIVQHNAQSQQTQVELTLGKMRTQVIKLTKPGASFEVKTQTAVIGVVGTTFIVNAGPNSTSVTCIDGVVTVQNVNPAIPGKVSLNSNQTTTVAAGAAPTAPVTASFAQMQTQLADTDVPTAPGAAQAGAQQGAGGTQGQAGAQGAGGGLGSTLSATSLAEVGAGGAALGTAVAAKAKANDALKALQLANSALQDATDAANAATTAIDEANQPPISPSTPCGCGP